MGDDPLARTWLVRTHRCGCSVGGELFVANSGSRRVTTAEKLPRLRLSIPRSCCRINLEVKGSPVDFRSSGTYALAATPISLTRAYSGPVEHSGSADCAAPAVPVATTSTA